LSYCPFWFGVPDLMKLEYYTTYLWSMKVCSKCLGQILVKFVACHVDGNTPTFKWPWITE
jgi:hypothetical protein